MRRWKIDKEEKLKGTEKGKKIRRRQRGIGEGGDEQKVRKKNEKRNRKDKEKRMSEEG